MKPKTETRRQDARATIVKNSPAIMDVFQAVAQRRYLQKKAFMEGVTSLDMASPITDENRKLRRLLQAVSEVGDAIEVGEQGSELADDQLQDALVCLAALTVGWLERKATV